jgi:hypothetical protein
LISVAHEEGAHNDLRAILYNDVAIQACALRAVTSTDGMTADYYPFEHVFLGRGAARIINECRDINRVTYDITSKPSGTIEWEWDTLDGSGGEWRKKNGGLWVSPSTVFGKGRCPQRVDILLGC